MDLRVEMDRNRIQTVVLELKDNLFDKTLTNRKLIKLSEKFANNATFLVGTEDVVVAGYVAFYCNDTVNRKAFISIVVIHHKYQHRGLGRLLIEEVCAIAQNAGMVSVGLQVAKSNIGAITFYKKHDFIIVAESECQYNMEKQLNFRADN